MKSPLLKSNHLNNARKELSRFYIFTFFSFCLFLVHYSLHTQGAYGAEKALGVSPERLERIALFNPYFILAYFPNAMRQQKNYAGRNFVKAHPFESHCTDDTPLCDVICRERKEIDPRVIRSPFCINEHNTWESGIKGERECWKSDTMRCWGVETSVWDGVQEWDVVRSDLDATIGVPWIQFNSRSDSIRFFIFGWGEIRPYREIISMIQGNSSDSLLDAISKVNPTDLIVLGGHSQGAAWAACLNVVLAQHGRGAEFRHVIGTGTPLADMHFHQRNEALASPAETSSFLLAALQAPSGRILTDITPINRAVDYPVKTFPQFGFACIAVGGKVTCLEPQPQQFSQADTVQMSQNNPNQRFITALHDFGTYGICFAACSSYFQTQQTGFFPNTLSFVKSIPSNSGQPSQLPMLHSSGLMIQPPQAPHNPPSIPGQTSTQFEGSAFHGPRPAAPTAAFQASGSPINPPRPSPINPPRPSFSFPPPRLLPPQNAAEQMRRGSQVLDHQQKVLRPAGSSSQAGSSNLEQAGYNYPSQFEQTGRDLPGPLRTIRPTAQHLAQAGSAEQPPQPQGRLRSDSRESASSGSGSPNLYTAGSPQEQAAIESLFAMNTVPQMPSRQGSSSTALDQAADALTLASASNSESPDALNIRIHWPERSLNTGNVSAEELRAAMDAVLATLGVRPRETLNVYARRIADEMRKQIRKAGKKLSTTFEQRSWFVQSVEEAFKAYRASERKERALSPN